MSRMKHLLLCLFLVIPGFAHAIEHLDRSCEVLLSQSGPTKIGLQTIQLTEDEILVRGKLRAHHEQGFEDMTIYAVFNEFFPRKIIQDPDLATFALQDNDHVYVLNHQNQILVHGYFRDISSVRSIKIDGKDIVYHPNLPGLFDRPDGHELLRPLDEMARLFDQRLEAVVVRKISSEERQKLKTIYEPLVTKYNLHLMDSGRYHRLNDHIQLTVAYFETVLDGRFGFKFTGPAHVYGEKPKVLDSSTVAVIPQLFDKETDREIPLEWLDQVYILDDNEKVLYSSEIRNTVQGRPILPVKDLVKFVDHIRHGRRIVVVRQNPMRL